jgi:hypothetical protein
VLVCVCVYVRMYISRLYETGKKENRVAGRPGQKQKIHSLSTHTHTHTLVDDGRRGPLVGGRRRRSEERK